MAQDPKNDYGEIKESMKGVVFMGTPHLVSEVAAKQYLQDLAKAIPIRGVRRKLLKALKPKSLELTNISGRFKRQTVSVQIVSMYEQNPTKREILVSYSSRPFTLPLARAFLVG
jgi:hypothetical protein